MKHAPLLSCLVLLISSTLMSCASNRLEQSSAAPASTSTLWKIDSLESIGGAKATVSGDPQVVESTLGNVVRFDGDGDRLLVDANPLENAQEFTIEIVFNPADVFPNNWEPRFFHIEAEDNPNRRLTIELRLNDKKQWYLDAYIKSENSQFTLIDPTLVHPVGKWAHAAVTYQQGDFISYVNGVRELSGRVEYLPIAAHAKTSVGARMNQVHWFKGDIAWVKITPRVLMPSEFTLLK